MSSNILDFTDYQNRTDIASLSDGVEDSVEHHLSNALLAMYDTGLLVVTRDEEGDLMFEANPAATEEDWDEGRAQYDGVDGLEDWAEESDD